VLIYIETAIIKGYCSPKNENENHFVSNLCRFLFCVCTHTHTHTQT